MVDHYLLFDKLHARGPLRGLSLTSPVIWNLAFSLERVLGLTPNNAPTWFCTEHQLEVALWQGPYPDQSGDQSGHLIGSTWGYQKLKTGVDSNSKITCLAMAEKIWQIFHGRNPHTQRCCSSHKCMFLTNGAPFERELNRLSTV